jgi:hypothetical protein
VKRELFEAEPFIGWALPIGWVPTSSSDRAMLSMSASEAGNSSKAALNGVYYNAAVMGYFTFLIPLVQLK